MIDHTALWNTNGLFSLLIFPKLDIHCWGTWEPCHKELLGHGIVGIENVGGDLEKVCGKEFEFFCLPLRWYMGDGCMVSCAARIDEEQLNDVKKGVLELVVLAALLDDDRYGYELTAGTLYLILKRLKDAGCLTTYLKESSGGPARKYYHLTDTGRGNGESSSRQTSSAVIFFSRTVISLAWIMVLRK